MAELRPVYGLVFLFKWLQEKDERPTLPLSDYHGKIFFAQQVITNACATQAILSILLNRQDLDLGEELTKLRSFTSEFPPDLKGHALSNSESIRQAHNSFRPPNPLFSEEKMDTVKDEDVYHFIAYLPVNGQLYELDGLKAGPISLCPCTEVAHPPALCLLIFGKEAMQQDFRHKQEDWLERVQPFIQQRIDKYSAHEIRFNLMAIIKDRRALYKEQLRLQEKLRMEEDKSAMWRAENVKRRHNYIPLTYNVLRILAEEGKLQSFIERARVPA